MMYHIHKNKDKIKYCFKAKTSETNDYQFKIKTNNKVRLDGAYIPQDNNVHLKQSHRNILLSGKELKIFTLVSGIRQECPLLH